MISVALLAAVALSATAPAPIPAEAVNEHWTLAKAYLARGLVRHAEDEARVVLRLDPGHAEARALLEAQAGPRPGGSTALAAEARRAYRENRAEEARELAGRALVAHPDDAAARAVLADLDEEAWQPSPLGGNDVLRGLFDQGIALYRKEEWAGAAEAFQKALATAPAHEQIRTFYARARDRADDAQITAALARAQSAADAGRIDEANEWILKVLAIRPGHAGALALRDKLGLGPEAAARLARFKEQFNRGVAAYEVGKWAEAVRAWEVAASLNPADAETKHLIAKARGKLGADRRAARKRNEGLNEEALRLYQQGKHDEARKVYLRILEGDPDDERAKRGLEVLDGKAAP